MATLEGQIIVVIGGTSGIGFAVAKGALQSRAAKVIVASSSQERVTEAVERLKKVGAAGEVVGKQLDASDYEAIGRFFEEVGEVNHLVFTAGELPQGVMGIPFKDMDLEVIKKMLDIRVWAAARCAQVAKISKGGSITFTSGSNSYKPMPGFGVAAAAGNAVIGLATGLAVDLAPVRVNCVTPGLVMTELIDRFGPMKDTLLETYTEKLLVKHVAAAEEAAETYLYLMKCDYITGQSIKVDGGLQLV